VAEALMHAPAGPLFDWQPGNPVAPRDAKPENLVKRPRPYQLEALEGGGSYVDKDGAAQTYPGIFRAWEQHRSVLVVLFTGGGKSYIAAQVALRRPGRTLVLVHADTLARQLRADLMHDTGRPWQLEKGDSRAVPEGGIDVVASVQTLAQPRRLERFRPDAFDTIIVDEAHHYVQEFFGRPLAYFHTAKVVLLTATPTRLDGVAMGSISDAVAYRKDLGAAQNEGWSTPIHWIPLGASVDVSGVDVNKFGEFVATQYDDALARQIAGPCRAALARCEDWRTLMFLPGVKSARAAAETLNHLRPGCARYVAGQQEMDSDVADKIIAAHKRGEFQFLANCRKLTEGYDDQRLICIIDAAKTASDGLCIQKVGRPSRLWPGLGSIEDLAERKAAIAASPKPRAIWFDLAYAGGPDRLAGPVDVLGGAYTQVERDWAKIFLEKNQGGDVLEALQWGRKHEEILAKKRAEAAARREKRKAADLAARRAAALAAGLDVTLIDLPKKKARPPKVNPKAVPPTPKQKARLEMWGIPVPATQAEASKEISKEFMARERGWCDHARRTKLAKYGVNAWGMSVATGARVWAALQRNGWQRLSDEQYKAALGRTDAGVDG
jgi:superfamily II DNA or RNA helicase